MKKIALLVAIVVVLIAATFVSYQSLFMQKPDEVLADIGSRVNAIKSVDATSHITLNANGVQLVDATGNIKSSGKPMDIADFLGSNPVRDPQDKFSEDFSINVGGSTHQTQAILDGGILYVKNPTLTDKWISEKFELASKDASSTATKNMPVEAKYMNALSMAGDFLKGFQNAREVSVEQVEDKQIRQLYIPVNEEAWRKAVDAKYPSLKLGTSNVSIDTNVWVDNETYLPTKYTVVLKADKPVKIEASCNLTFKSFNQALNIAAPPAEQVMTVEAYERNDKLKKLFDEAVKCFNAREFKKAQGLINELAKEWPSNPAVMELLAQVEFEVGDYDLARNYLDKAEILNPKSAPVFAYRSLLAVEDGKFGAALSYGKKAVELNPIYPKAYLAQGCGYLGLGNTASAEECFETAMELDPNMPEPAAMLTICYGDKGNYDKALRYFKKSKVSVDDPRATKVANKALKTLNISLDKIRDLPQDILKRLADTSKVSDLQAAIKSKEKPVFIYFFEKQCPISLELADALKDLKDKHSSEVAFFVFDVASGPDALQLVSSYGVKTTPTMVIIKRDGTIAGTYDGYVDNRELEKWVLDAK
jgi:tetratricopeptide (TPR) repeat protein